MQLTCGELKQLFPNNTIRHADDVVVAGVSKDTRTLTAGYVYAAIRGEKFDGHDFVADARKAGAAMVLVERSQGQDNEIVVADVVKALGDLAKFYRAKFTQPVIAITGSSGKTTTKEMLSHVLSTAGEVVATKGNLNNHIGVPLTIFEFRNSAKFFIVEMGMNHFHEIEYLCSITAPTMATITSIGRAHLEGVGGTLEGVAKAKGELFEGLDANATALVLQDEPLIVKMPTRARRVTFGLSSNTTYHATDQIQTSDATTLTIVEPRGQFKLTLPLVGKHHVQNALNVYAMARELGLSADKVIGALESFEIQGSRGRIVTRANMTFVDDCYNANPDSMRAAIASFSERFESQYKIAVLGVMRELGANNEVALHTEIGRFCREKKIDELLVLGDLAGYYLDGFYGSVQQQRWAKSHDDLADKLKALAKGKQAAVLVKGSRSNQLEKMYEFL